jgi:hypothetical protein
MDFSDPTPKLLPVISREHVERLLGGSFYSRVWQTSYWFLNIYFLQADFFIWESVFTIGNRFVPLLGLKAPENSMRPQPRQEIYNGTKTDLRKFRHLPALTHFTG